MILPSRKMTHFGFMDDYVNLTNLKGVSEPQVQKSFQRMNHPG